MAMDMALNVEYPCYTVFVVPVASRGSHPPGATASSDTPHLVPRAKSRTRQMQPCRSHQPPPTLAGC